MKPRACPNNRDKGLERTTDTDVAGITKQMVFFGRRTRMRILASNHYEFQPATHELHSFDEQYLSTKNQRETLTE
jgi:hypothetical protein